MCNCTGTGHYGDRCQAETDECRSNPCRNGATCHVRLHTADVELMDSGCRDLILAPVMSHLHIGIMCVINFMLRGKRVISSFGSPISGVLCACLGIPPKDTDHLRRSKKKKKARQSEIAFPHSLKQTHS